MELFADKREKGVLDMVDFLVFKQGIVVKLEDERVASEMKGNIWRFMECGTTPILADFFPIFDGIDIQGQKKKAKRCLDNLFKIWEGIIKERREEHHCNESDVKKYGDFLDLMLANGFSDDQINYMLLEIFPAGTGTLTSTIEWALAELLRNKDVMKKFFSELQNGINSNPIKESTIFQLSYLNACIKEVLRLHPPIAFLPHYASQDFEFLPFGAGRRMCPGLSFATKEVHLIFACLVYHFEWSLPNNGDPLMLDMNEKYAVPLQREKLLLLVPTRK
ncbi:(S)-N-methylcoclaurine 3'-hydroxylase isozyme 1-like [Lycium ferocissimum]|uniref:(S)-N-methylcoclaurine 3'-hydroxylase isozyme 1-like n=1 Tax=Lycium ferocissimum TaxID=112874 RepID=UPI00281624D9|nr:(S)-N-methylcoclaurine 3'-hydroxylase isozyme 1-like [Lycium ferocissimum]